MTIILVSEKVRAYRREHRMTQEAFGALLGVSPQAISKWERVECYPDIIFLPALAELLQCSIHDFFEISN